MSRPSAPPAPPSAWTARGAAVVVAATLLWAAIGIGVDARALASVPGEVAAALSRLFPPDVEYGRQRVLDAVVESLEIAWVGTLLGALLSLPLCFAAARTLAPRSSRAVKVVLAAVRSVPEILLAIYFVPIVGLGAFAGTLAIGLHSVGSLGKLGAEVVESMDGGAAEAVRAAGGSQLAVARWAVLPEVLPEIVALWLYRFEINVRASAVLGVVGAGGIGGVLLNTLRYRRFDKAGAVILITVGVVLIVDWVSGAVRKRLIE